MHTGGAGSPRRGSRGRRPTTAPSPPVGSTRRRGRVRGRPGGAGAASHQGSLQGVGGNSPTPRGATARRGQPRPARSRRPGGQSGLPGQVGENRRSMSPDPPNDLVLI